MLPEHSSGWRVGAIAFSIFTIIISDVNPVICIAIFKYERLEFAWNSTIKNVLCFIMDL